MICFIIQSILEIFHYQWKTLLNVEVTFFIWFFCPSQMHCWWSLQRNKALFTVCVCWSHIYTIQVFISTSDLKIKVTYSHPKLFYGKHLLRISCFFLYDALRQKIICLCKLNMSTSLQNNFETTQIQCYPWSSQQILIRN